MKKIVVDAFGADKGVGVMVKGAVDSLARRNDTVVVLVGDEEEINRELCGLKYDKSRIEVVGTTEFITNDESPTEAIRAKTDSSLVRALEITKNDSFVAGMVSARCLPARYLSSAESAACADPLFVRFCPRRTAARCALSIAARTWIARPIGSCSSRSWRMTI